jgi:diguanylate cyclase (GGDEF)-like protein
LKIEDVRNSFTVYLVASEGDRLSGIGESLGLAGYMVASFNELTAAFSELHSNPPHFILFEAEESKFNLTKAIKQVTAQLPETHIFLITPLAKREASAPLLEEGVHDLILTPLASHVELVRALDQAAERDYFMYMNERLTQEMQNAPQPTEVGELTQVPKTTAAPADDFHLSSARGLFEQKTADECIAYFLKVVSQALGACPVVFLKYINNRRVLLASVAEGLEGTDLNGFGLNFNELNPGGFRTAQLRDPKGVPEIESLMHEVFHAPEFFAFPVDALSELQGIVCFLRPDPPPELGSVVNDWMMLLGKALSMLESEKRLHVMCVKDPATDLLNRANLIARVREEISRARRTSMPVSLALLTIDQYGQIVSQVGHEEAQTLLKMVARIFERHSRVNDVIGRTGADEFGIILPHTGKQGAMIKAERLRRIIESADFSRVVSSFPSITISLGVSEYPSMVRDAEELLQSADEALYQVRTVGNKTCVAKPPDGFVADFEVHEKGL